MMTFLNCSIWNSEKWCLRIKKDIAFCLLINIFYLLWNLVNTWSSYFYQLTLSESWGPPSVESLVSSGWLVVSLQRFSKIACYSLSKSASCLIRSVGICCKSGVRFSCSAMGLIPEALYIISGSYIVVKIIACVLLWQRNI